jgi:hypothetical protein
LAALESVEVRTRCFAPVFVTRHVTHDVVDAGERAFTAVNVMSRRGMSGENTSCTRRSVHARERVEKSSVA